MNTRLHLLPMFSLVALACTASTSPSSQDEPVSSTREGISGGEAVSIGDPINEIIAKVTLGPDGYNEDAVCTGTFLLQDWVLTAAHCVLQTPENPPSPMWPTTELWVHNTSSKEADNVSAVDRIVALPWNPKVEGSPDIALLHVTPEQGAGPNFQTHSPFFEVPLMHTAVAPTRLLEFYGYGFLIDNDPTPYRDLTLHEGVFEVATVTSNGYDASDRDYYSAFPMQGDSGGPAFALDFVNSNGFGRLLAGVDSTAYEASGTQPEPYVFQTGVSVYASWIESYISADHITDLGSSAVQANVDIDGDHVLDYCRIAGPANLQFLACQIGMFNESQSGVPTRWQLDPYGFRTGH